MPAKKIFSLLALSALLSFPAGIATAGEIDIQNEDVRVRVGPDSGVSIQTDPTRTTISPLRVPSASRARIYQRIYRNRIPNLRTLRIPSKRTTTLGCNGRTVTQQSVHRSSSGSSSNQTYSSQTTTTCR